MKLYFSFLNNRQETKIHEGKEFIYPVISKSGYYISYTKEESLYIFDMQNKKYEKIADNSIFDYHNEGRALGFMDILETL